jgi:hypothetical protein
MLTVKDLHRIMSLWLANNIFRAAVLCVRVRGLDILLPRNPLLLKGWYAKLACRPDHLYMHIRNVRFRCATTTLFNGDWNRIVRTTLRVNKLEYQRHAVARALARCVRPGLGHPACKAVNIVLEYVTKRAVNTASLLPFTGSVVLQRRDQSSAAFPIIDPVTTVNAFRAGSIVSPAVASLCASTIRSSVANATPDQSRAIGNSGLESVKAIGIRRSDNDDTGSIAPSLPLPVAALYRPGMNTNGRLATPGDSITRHLMESGHTLRADRTGASILADPAAARAAWESIFTVQRELQASRALQRDKPAFVRPNG